MEDTESSSTEKKQKFGDIVKHKTFSIVKGIASRTKDFTVLQKTIFWGLTSIVVAVTAGDVSLFIFYLVTIFLATLAAKYTVKYDKYFQTDKLHHGYLIVKDFYSDLNRVERADLNTSSDNDQEVKGSLQPELDRLFHLVKRDLIQSWSSMVSDNAETIDETAEKLLICVYTALQTEAELKGRDEILNKLLLVLRKHLTTYQNAVMYWRKQPTYTHKRIGHEFKKISSLEEAWEKVGHFHAAVKSENEMTYCRNVVGLLIRETLSEELYKATTGREVLCEILATKLLFPVINLAANPDWLHQMVVKILSDEKLELVVASGPTQPHQPCIQYDDYNDVLQKNSVTPPQPCVVSEADASETDCSKAEDTNQETGCDNDFKEVEDFQDTAPPTNVPELKETNDSHGDSDEIEVKLNKDDGHDTQEPLQPGGNVFERIQDSFISSDLGKFFKLAPKSRSNSPTVPVKQISGSTVNDETMDNENVINNKTVINDDNTQLNDKATISENTNQSQMLESLNDTDKEADSVRKPKSPIKQHSSSYLRRHLLQSLGIDGDQAADNINSSPSQEATKQGDLDATKRPDSLGLKEQILQSSDSYSDNTPFTEISVRDMMTDAPGHLSYTRSASHPPVKFGLYSNDETDQHDDVCPNCQGIQSTLNINDTSPSKARSNTIDGCDTSSSRPLLAGQEKRPCTCSQFIITKSLKIPVSIGSIPDGQLLSSSAESGGLQSSSPSLTPPISPTVDPGVTKVIQAIAIPATEKATEPRSSKNYILYVIEYNAWYRTDADEVVIQHKQAKRRYSEFVNLQSRLEENTLYKHSLKDIKGPSKWFTNPFGSLDESSVEMRRQALEKYMQSLCAKPDLNTSPELKEFLAYEGNAHIAFVKKASEVRIDRMLAKTVSGVFDKIGSVLEPVSRSSAIKKEQMLIDSLEDTLKIKFGETQENKEGQRLQKVLDKEIRKKDFMAKDSDNTGKDIGDSNTDNQTQTNVDKNQNSSTGDSSSTESVETDSTDFPSKIKRGSIMSLHSIKETKEIDASPKESNLVDMDEYVNIATPVKTKPDNVDSDDVKPPSEELETFHDPQEHTSVVTCTEKISDLDSETTECDEKPSENITDKPEPQEKGSLLKNSEDDLQNSSTLKCIADAGVEVPKQVTPTPVQDKQGLCMASGVLDIGLQTLQGTDNWVCREQVLKAFKTTLGKALDSWLVLTITELTDEPSWAKYIRLLHETLWPEGVRDTSPALERSQEQKDLTRAQAQRCLKDFFPGFLLLLVGDEDFDQAVKLVMNVFDDPKLNRHLAFCILDCLLDLLVPDVAKEDLAKKMPIVKD